MLGQVRRIIHRLVRVLAVLGDRLLVKELAQRAIVKRPGMRVCGRNQNVAGGDAGLLGRQVAGMAGDLWR